jgi:tripartite-type tricarboxylate transporter receptor subunit TctC
MTPPLRLIVGFSTGSMSAQVARTIAPALSDVLRRDVTVELVPGQNGALGASLVAQSHADGDMLFVATLGTHALAPHVNRELPYRPVLDFAPVSLISQSPLVLATHPALGVTSVSELVDFAQGHPGTLTYGTSALGGAPHLAAELFQDLAGITMRHVRYDDTNRLYDDLEAGRIALSFNNVASLLPRCTQGRLVALAITSAERSTAAADLPAVAETLPGYQVTNWVGLVAPASTADEVTRSLSRAAGEALHVQSVAATFVAAGMLARGTTPEEFRGFIEREIGRWEIVVARFRDRIQEQEQA